MKDLQKVNSQQLYDTWKNVAGSLFIIMAVIIGCRLFPFYLSPVIGLIGSVMLYSILYRNKENGGSSCMLVPYSLFFCLITFSFLSIFANVLYIWGLVDLPDEFIFFNDPYIPTLWMNPICFITLIVIQRRRKKLHLCVQCRMKNGTHAERGIYGGIINTESSIQLRNLTIIFGILSVVVWTYYLIEYKSLMANSRDLYIFFWTTIIVLFLDQGYFIFRYYNLYLDLKENNELITPEELRAMDDKTYLRYYVICGDDVFLCPDMDDVKNPIHKGIDTPFFTTRNTSNITAEEAKRIIKEMTGAEGELKFFYGKRNADIEKLTILRYFYFLSGDISEHSDLHRQGEWMPFQMLKQLYTHTPALLGTMVVNDMTRLATIMVTSKLYTPEGQRKIKLKSYNPSFDLKEVKNSNHDFQEDKWLKVARFNSDTRFYKLRKRLRNLYLKTP